MPNGTKTKIINIMFQTATTTTTTKIAIATARNNNSKFNNNSNKIETARIRATTMVTAKIIIEKTPSPPPTIATIIPAILRKIRRKFIICRVKKSSIKFNSSSFYASTVKEISLIFSIDLLWILFLK